MATQAKATTTVYINNEPAKAALEALEQRLVAVKQAREAAFASGDKNALTKLDREINSINGQIDRTRRKFLDVDAVMKDLSGASLRDLNAALARTRAEFSKMRQDDPQFNERRNQINQLEAAITSARGRTQEANSTFMGLRGTFTAMAGWIAGAVAVVGGLWASLSNLIAVRSEFEKYESILRNTLGSQTLATEAMGMLRDVANELPLSLQEATEAYITMLNRGMKPTREEMVSLTDMALSQGRSLDQFVEAMLDAQTGEFERLKEFGIKAKKEGDEVTFMFRGQTTVVQNNEDAINAYLMSLGNLPGIAGSSAAVMETLGGALSNAGDATDNLLNTMGDGGLGNAIKSVVRSYSDLANTVADWIKLDPAEELEKEQVAVNKLVIQLTSANLSEADRKKVLTELKDLAPDIAAAIESEKGGIDELRTTLDQYNKKMAEKIALKQVEMKLDDQKEEVAKYQQVRAENEADLAVAINESLAWFKEKNADYVEKVNAIIYDSNLDIYQKARKVNSLALEASKIGNPDLYNVLDQTERIRERWRKESNLLDRIEKEVEEKKKNIIATFGAEPEATPPPPKPEPEDPEGGSKEKETLKQQLSDLKFDRFDEKSLKKDFEKEMDDILKDEDKFIEEFTKKWDDYTKMRGEYGIGLHEADTHDLAMAQLQAWHDEQLISEQEFQDAKAAIERVAEQDKQIRAAENRDMELEMKAIDMEQSQFDFEAELALEDERYQTRIDLEQTYYDKEVMLAAGNKDKLLQIELNHKKQLAAINGDHVQQQQKIVKKEMDMQMGRLQLMQAVSGGIVDVMGKETFASKAALIIKQGAALAEATMALGVGHANTAKVGFPQNVPLIAAFIAQTAGLINTIRSAVGKKSGGYTDADSSDDQVVDYVHANEFVANANAVRNPTIKPILDIIDFAQRAGTIRTINLPAALSQTGGRGYRDGGYTSPVDAPQNMGGASSDMSGAILAMIAENTRTLKKIQDEGLTGRWDYDYYKRSLSKLDKIDKDVSA